MTKGLSVSGIVNVTVNLSPLAAGYRNFGDLLILGSSAVIDVNERSRYYANLDGIAQDFGVSAPEYQAASLFFSQSPQPNECYVGRWAQSATPGLVKGATLSAAQRLLSNFTPVTTGAFNVSVNGVPYAISGLNFSSALNINGVASAIQAALPSGVICKYNSVYNRFDIISGTTGVGSSVSYASAPAATGGITFPANPSNNDTIALNGTTVTFKTASPTGNQVLIGASLAATLQNLLTFLNSSTDTQIVKFSYGISGGNRLNTTAVAPGAGGASLTLAASAATVSGATLAGGSGNDISTLLALTAAAGASAPVAGIGAETLVQCVAALADASSQWYGLTVATATPPADADHLAVAALIEGLGQSHIYGVNISNPNVLDSTQTNDLASVLKSFNYERTFTHYSSSSPYAVASLYGRAFTVDFEANNTTITLKFKQEPGVQAETITESQAQTLKAKNCNVFVNYCNGKAIIQEGVMANGYFFDEVHGTDWLQNRIQVDVFNLLYQSPTKIPQTDAGVHQIVTTITGSCAAGVNNGLIAPGVWNVNGFGSLKQGDTLTSGYYVFAPLVATQSQALRETRVAPTIQCAIKLAGAIHKSNILVQVNR